MVVASLVLASCANAPPQTPDTPIRLLCSGQSNMAYTVARAEASGWTRPDDVAARLAATDIHFSTLARNPQIAPVPSASPTITRASGDNVGEVSSLCLFTALDLAEATGRPVEFVVAAVGGSQIEPWLPVPAAEALGLVDDRHRAFLQDPARLTADWENGVKRVLDREPPPEAAAGKITVPGRWEDQGFASLDGLVWLETGFELSAEQVSQTALLSLAQVDDWDTSFVNYCEVASTFSWDLPRRYIVPANCLQPGRNTLRVRVVDTGGSGGIRGAQGDVFISFGEGMPSLSLAGDWLLSPGGTIPDLPERPGNDRSAPSLLYNGMIAPLGAQDFDAIIWYQGEANAYSGDTPDAYAAKLLGMMAAWRNLFDDPELAFYLVQLPEFDPGERAGPFAFGDIRIGQFLAAEADAHVTLVPALGLGTPDDIHPPDKVALASRVADAFLQRSQTPADCQLSALQGRSGVGPVEICANGFAACRDARVEMANGLQMLNEVERVDLQEGEQLVLGRSNVPSQWYICARGAVAADVRRD